MQSTRRVLRHFGDDNNNNWWKMSPSDEDCSRARHACGSQTHKGQGLIYWWVSGSRSQGVPGICKPRLDAAQSLISEHSRRQRSQVSCSQALQLSASTTVLLPLSLPPPPTHTNIPAVSLPSAPNGSAGFGQLWMYHSLSTVTPRCHTDVVTTRQNPLV